MAQKICSICGGNDHFSENCPELKPEIVEMNSEDLKEGKILPNPRLWGLSRQK